VATLTLSGALDRTTVPELWAKHASATSLQGGVVSLAGVESIDSAGLALLTALRRKHGIRLTDVPAAARTLARAYDVETLLDEA